MKHLFDSSSEEIRDCIKKYMHNGIYSRVIHCYERLLYLGKLRKNEYLRLAVLYIRRGKENQAQRIITRYKQIYGII